MSRTESEFGGREFRRLSAVGVATVEGEVGGGEGREGVSEDGSGSCEGELELIAVGFGFGFGFSFEFGFELGLGCGFAAAAVAIYLP